MTQQDKDLLLRDLSARIQYGVECEFIWKEKGNHHRLKEIWKEFLERICYFHNGPSVKIEGVRPYLRPLSSLTQEERDKFCDIGGVISHRPDGKLYLVAYFPEALDYLNSIHADYRGMIEKGLAIEVTDENNPYK